MIKDMNAPLSMFKATYFKASLTSFTVCCVLNTGLTYAEPLNNNSERFRATAGYPLLADNRSNNWKYNNERIKNKTDRHNNPQYTVKKQEHKDRRHWDEPNYRDHNIRQPHATHYSYQRHHHPGYQRIKPRYTHPRHHHPRHHVRVRPFHYSYPHHRHHSYSQDIWGILAFTAITVTILDNLNAQQQREHELALYKATSTPLGETIYWRDSDVSGSVTPTRDGTSSTGRYCREFRNEVTIGGDRETVYGTACQNPDGSWEIEQ